MRVGLAHYSVRALSRLALGGLDLQAELLDHVPADKPADAVILLDV